MNSVNHVLILGHLTRNPRLTNLPSGKKARAHGMSKSAISVTEKGRSWPDAGAPPPSANAAARRKGLVCRAIVSLPPGFDGPKDNLAGVAAATGPR